MSITGLFLTSLPGNSSLSGQHYFFLLILWTPAYTPEPVVIVAIWRRNREAVQGQSTVSGEAAPTLHVFSSYRQRTC
jgi:hypothetical protein